MRRSQLAVKLLVICLFLVHPMGFADDDHDDHGDAPVKSKNPGPGPKGAAAPFKRDAGGNRCGVPANRLSDFANGENYDFNSMVEFLTSSECQENGRQVSSVALKTGGVKFVSAGPIKLEDYAKAITPNDFEGMRRIDNNLAKSIPPILRQYPMSSKELMPILGQLALLSPTAARSTLVKIIHKELYTSDAILQAEPEGRRQKTAVELAQTLVRMGANETLIATEMSDSVEDLALLSQADSLAKYFRALGAATAIDPILAPTFNLSAAAFNRGVQRGKKIFQRDERSELLKSVFWAIRAAMGGADSLETGAVELNEALASLINGYPLQATSLKLAWKEAIKVLVQTPTQAALADAIAASLTADVVFLPADDIHLMLAAAKTYPALAYSLQSNYILAFSALWEGLQNGEIPTQKYNAMRAKFFEPLVVSILDLGPDLVDSRWLRQVWRRGLIQDSEIEKRFPRYMLSFIDKRDRAAKKIGKETGIESTVSVMAENMAVLWTLSNTHVPALMDWVKRYEEN